MRCRRDRRVVLVTLAAAGLGAACGTFHTPRAATLATVAPSPLAALVPGAFEVELTSPGLAGTFDVVCAVTEQSFRVQLFPDVGGKVLDVRVGAAAVTAEWPGGTYRAEAPLAAAEPHLALVFALLCGELLAPVSAARVLGERDADGCVEVELRPALGSGRVVARLAADGSVAAYDLALGWLEVHLDAQGRFSGRGVSGHLRRRGASATTRAHRGAARGALLAVERR